MRLGMILDKDEAARILESGGSVFGVQFGCFEAYYIKLKSSTLDRFIAAADEDYGEWAFIVDGINDIEQGDEIDFNEGRYCFFYDMKRLPNFSTLERWRDNYHARQRNCQED